MTRKLHLFAALAATLVIAAFLLSTAFVELFGSAQAVAALKSLIVMPGLLVLVPALASAGASGFALSRSRRGQLVENKKRRMPIIAGNGLLVLVPCAIFLDRWAAAGQFDGAFYTVQALELFAGSLNLVLMALNIRDGVRLSRRFTRCHAAEEARVSPT